MGYAMRLLQLVLPNAIDGDKLRLEDYLAINRLIHSSEG